MASRKRFHGQARFGRPVGEIGVHEKVQEVGRGAIGRLRTPEPHIDQPLPLRDLEQGPGPPPARHARTRDDPRRRRRCIPRGPGDLDLGVSSRSGSAQRTHSRLSGNTARKGSRQGTRPVSMSRPVGRRRKRHSTLSTSVGSARVSISLSNGIDSAQIIPTGSASDTFRTRTQVSSRCVRDTREG